MKLIDLLYNPPDKQVFCGEKTDYEAWEKQIKDLILKELPNENIETAPDSSYEAAWCDCVAEMRRRIELL